MAASLNKEPNKTPLNWVRIVKPGPKEIMLKSSVLLANHKLKYKNRMKTLMMKAQMMNKFDQDRISTTFNASRGRTKSSIRQSYKESDLLGIYESLIIILAYEDFSQAKASSRLVSDKSPQDIFIKPLDLKMFRTYTKHTQASFRKSELAQSQIVQSRPTNSKIVLL